MQEGAEILESRLNMDRLEFNHDHEWKIMNLAPNHSIYQTEWCRVLCCRAAGEPLDRGSRICHRLLAILPLIDMCNHTSTQEVCHLRVATDGNPYLSSLIQANQP